MNLFVSNTTRTRAFCVVGHGGFSPMQNASINAWNEILIFLSPLARKDGDALVISDQLDSTTSVAILQHSKLTL